MAEVRRLLTLQGGVIKTEAGTVAGPFIKLVGEMIKSKSDWVNECANIIGTTQGSERQWVGVLTEAIDQLAVWSYDRIKAATQTSDFHFEDVRENTTIYICIPPDHISAYRAFLRVVVGCAMRELKTSYSGDRDEKPVLMVLDEFPLLHHMQPIEDSLAYIAGYGVKLWFFVQDIGQFQQHYPSTWRSFIANCGVRTFFGVSDYETAKLVSDMTGQSTVASETRGVNENRTEAEAFGKSQHSGWSGPHASSGDATSYTKTFSTSVGSSLSVTYVGRPLVMPDEVMRLHAFEQIIFIKGELPIRAWMLPYDANKMMASRLLPPPKPGALPPARPAKSQSAPGPVPEARAAEEIAF
jgi:type IV secretion system protein VirD4